MIAIALIHSYFGGESPLNYVRNKFGYFFLGAAALSTKMISVNMTTVWKEFSYIFINMQF